MGRPASAAKYKPLAGPNGGNGGKGGSVILKADQNATSLLDFRFMPHRTADSGTMGLSDTKDGSNGADLVLPVPVGTVVFEARGAQGSPKKPGAVLADLRHAGDTYVAAAGGAGGSAMRRWRTRHAVHPGLRCSANRATNATSFSSSSQSQTSRSWASPRRASRRSSPR